MLRLLYLSIFILVSCRPGVKAPTPHEPIPEVAQEIKTLIPEKIVLDQNVYFVNPHMTSGDDKETSPTFKSISAAIDTAPDNTTIYLRAGRYSRPLKIKNSSKRLKIVAYPGEEVIFDGTETLDLKWHEHKEGIFKAKVAHPIWQLFVDNDLADMARWPNANFKDGKIWRMTQSMRSLNGGYKNGKPTGKSRLGLAYDEAFKSHSKNGFNEGDSRYSDVANTASLAESGIDFTGAIAVLNIGHWLTWARPITKHSAGADHFTYDPIGLNTKNLRVHSAYYLYGLAALDKENEWWYDKDTQMLYYKAADLADLKQKVFSSRKYDFMLDFHNVKNLSFENIAFFSAGYSIVKSENIRLENCQFDYPSTNKFILGNFNTFTNFNKKSAPPMSTFFGGKNHQIINCRFSKSNAPISFNSENTLVTNCLFEDVEWDVNSHGGSGSVMIGANSTLSHSTLSKTGNSEGLRVIEPGCTITYNHVYNAGNLQHDGSGINVGTKVQTGTSVTHNWVHDCNRQGIRFDYHGENIYQKDGRIYGDGLYAFNVTWKTQPNQVKGDRHIIANNTVVSCNYFPEPEKEMFNMSVQGFKAMHGIQGNEDSLIFNNLANLSHRSWDLRILKKRQGNEHKPNPHYRDLNYHVLPGTIKNNMLEAGAAYKYLRDPQNWDFRPKSGSPLIGAAKTFSGIQLPNKLHKINSLQSSPSDIGAYQSADPSYWIPGQRQTNASIPIPLDQAEEINESVELIFLGAYQAQKHRIYYGTDKNKLKLITELTETNICSIDKLKANKTYYWRVDSQVNNRLRKGKTWSFKTAAIQR